MNVESLTFGAYCELPKVCLFALFLDMVYYTTYIFIMMFEHCLSEPTSNGQPIQVFPLEVYKIDVVLW